MVVVGGVVEDAFVEVVAGGVDGVFVTLGGVCRGAGFGRCCVSICVGVCAGDCVGGDVAAAVLLVDGVEDVEELADAGKLVVGGEGI